MQLVFLGTSAGAPTLRRNVTSHALVLDDGAVWLCDCGEGTQHRIAEHGVKARAIALILITHLHGDHCYGLPGLLSAMAIAGRSEPLCIVGPQGVRAWVEMTVAMSQAVLPFSLDFRELSAPREVVALPESATTAAALWQVTAVAIHHRIACWGYALRSPQRARRLDLARATALGVPAPQRKHLVRGESITLDDGRVIAPDDCCAPPRPGRLIGLLGDTDNADAMIADLQGADLIVREATYAATRQDQALQWGHSTTTMTGAFAAACTAKHLVVTHLSARYTIPSDGRNPDVAALRDEVQAACPGIRVTMADDGVRVDIP